ncbi:MAG TPA: MFS transporter [Candidatus Polarisedimenticolaceae bacterium]|nr:MFS transporter [Candidatus Polarisedimenticolaceae bacterium]
MLDSLRSNPLTRFILLYAAMYAGFGVASPFLPSFLSARGLPPEQLGVMLGAGTAIRLLTAPLAGRIGDLIQALRVVLVICTALSAAATLSYLAAHDLWILLCVSLLHAASLAPITILADALAVGSATPPATSARRGFEYGWVRGTGSAAFIIGTLLSGQAVSAFGLDIIIWLQALLLGIAAFAAILVPELIHDRSADIVRSPAGGVRVLFRIAQFRNLVIVAALILGSHAMHDAFAVIRWSAAGVGPATASLLWSEAVAAEVLVFFLIGPVIVKRLTPAGALATAALAGMLRWTVVAQTTDVIALGLIQPLHGITFALLHLACMQLIARIVPQGLEGTAQAIYGTVGIGAATALLTLVSGALYARLGAQGFWVMAALCALALPLTLKLRERY